MKIYKISFLLLILVSFNSCNKKSSVSKTNTESKFKYEYVFSFEDTDTSRVKIEKKEATKNKIKGIVSDRNGTMPHCYIQLIGIDKSYKKTVEIDFYGNFEEEIPKGRYRIQTSGTLSDHINFKFEIEENQELIFDIYLKSTQLPTIYEINSKTPLSKDKIEEIKKRRTLLGEKWRLLYFYTNLIQSTKIVKHKPPKSSCRYNN